MLVGLPPENAVTLVLHLAIYRFRAELGSPRRDANPRHLTGAVVGREHGVHLERGHHHGVIAVLIELLTRALPKSFVRDR